MLSLTLSLSFSNETIIWFSFANLRIFTDKFRECARSTMNTPKNSPTKNAKPRWVTNHATQPIIN